MKHLRDGLLLCVGLVGLLALATTASAGLFGMDKTAAGTVFNVEGNTLTIMSKTSPNQSASIDVQVTDQTEFNSIQSIGQLEKGDQVEVSYKEHSGQNVAVSITRVQALQDKLSYYKFVEKLNPLQ